MLAYLLLGVAQVAGLLLIPFGAPGTWLQLGALALFGWWSGFEAVGGIPLLILLAIVLAAEVAEAPLTSGRIPPVTRRKAGFGGVAGAAAGAVAGMRLPLLGGMFGALAGALVGTFVGAVAARAPRSGWPTLGAHVLALTLRSTAGVVIAAFTFLTIRG